MTEEAAPLADHSPISASGMYRWSVCPGSVALSFGAPSTSSSFAQDGTAAHSLGEACFAENMDAWEYIGHHFKGVEVDKDMADAVQVYLDAVRVRHPNRDQGNSWIERSFHCGAIHDQMYGTADLVYYNQGQRSLDVWDYKHGAGIVVDVQENPQLMYYGVGMLEDLDLWGKVDKVTLHIAQPRGWHPDGPIRSWTISTEALAEWRDEVLLPAMELAQTSTETISGPHCRFCPARAMACPAIAADMDELEELMTEFTERGGAEGLSNEQVGLQRGEPCSLPPPQCWYAHPRPQAGDVSYQPSVAGGSGGGRSRCHWLGLRLRSREAEDPSADREAGWRHSVDR